MTNALLSEHFPCRYSSNTPQINCLLLQVALLWQRDRATRLSVEILQLRLAVFVQYRSVTDKQTDGQTHDDSMYRT